MEEEESVLFLLYCIFFSSLLKEVFFSTRFDSAQVFPCFFFSALKKTEHCREEFLRFLKATEQLDNNKPEK